MFDIIRRPDEAPGAWCAEQETHALLRRIQANGAFFDATNVLYTQSRQPRPAGGCPPLAEILHIRRDLWAASEIVLMEDMSVLGKDFATEDARKQFRAEAEALLFKDAASGPDDLIDLRLSLAREEVAQFLADAEEAARLAREADRLPSPRQFAAHAAAPVLAIPGRVRAARHHLIEFYRSVVARAGRIRETRSLTVGLAKLRQAREELPGRITAGAARGKALARRSTAQLKRRYDFLLAAHDIPARYAQAMRKRPEITAHARQFIARLDLAARSERLRLTPASYIERAKRYIALWLAHLPRCLLIAASKQLHQSNEGLRRSWTKLVHRHLRRDAWLIAANRHLLAALPRWQAKFNEAREETAKAAAAHPVLPLALRWPPDEPENKTEG